MLYPVAKFAVGAARAVLTRAVILSAAKNLNQQANAQRYAT
jgi:hypothetical protein